MEIHFIKSKSKRSVAKMQFNIDGDGFLKLWDTTVIVMFL